MYVCVCIHKVSMAVKPFVPPRFSHEEEEVSMPGLVAESAVLGDDDGATLYVCVYICVST